VTEYLLSQREAPDLERTRLKLLAEVHDPLTVAQLDAIGVDLLREPLPADGFDLVHARLLLIHLPSRLAALRRLASAARPGGWVAVMDPDFTTVALSPASLAWARTWSAFLDAVIVAGWDPRYGARLCGEMRAIGLADVHGEYVAGCEPGGSVPARLLSLTLERLRDRLIAFGAESEEIDEARRALEDPSSEFRSPTRCVARGRRPVA
jgi:SAM-dependent methyltransferase